MEVAEAYCHQEPTKTAVRCIPSGSVVLNANGVPMMVLNWGREGQCYNGRVHVANLVTGATHDVDHDHKYEVVDARMKWARKR